ncbi:hypothetical protein D3C85_1123590 [compost metagenome]
MDFGLLVTVDHHLHPLLQEGILDVVDHALQRQHAAAPRIARQGFQQLGLLQHVELEGSKQPLEAFEGFTDDGEGELSQGGPHGSPDHDEEGGQIEQGARMPALDHVATQYGCQGKQQTDQTHVSRSLCIECG